MLAGPLGIEALLWIAVQTRWASRPHISALSPQSWSFTSSLQTQDSEDKAVEWRTTSRQAARCPSARSYDCSTARRIERPKAPGSSTGIPRFHFRLAAVPLDEPHCGDGGKAADGYGRVTPVSARIHSGSVGANPYANAPSRAKMRRRNASFSLALIHSRRHRDCRPPSRASLPPFSCCSRPAVSDESLHSPDSGAALGKAVGIKLIDCNETPRSAARQ
jgi:hypothetical protein